MKKYLLVSLLVIAGLFTKAQLTIQIMHDGALRSFNIHVPPNYTTSYAYPMVLNFHGYSSNAAQQELYSLMGPVSDTGNFIVVYPEGLSNAWNVGFVGDYNTTLPDDVGFTSKIIDTMATMYSVNLNRVYACGMSNGGYFSYRLACELPEKIAAIASVTGSMTDSMHLYCNPMRKMPMMQIHGTVDPLVPYNGQFNSMGIENMISFWLNEKGCTTPGDTVQIPNSLANDSSTVEKITYNCNEGYEFVYFKITNGGHTWPSGAINVPGLGPTNRDISASREIWNFFNRYTKEGGVGIEETEQPTVKLYPNPANSILHLEADNIFTNAEIYNLLGEKVIVKQLEGLNNNMDITGLQHGLYFIKLSNPKTQKVVKFEKN